MSAVPAPRPCGSCPYRRDVPSGIWHADEYAKLPAYDRPTQEQPAAAFHCHQQDGRLCAGWVGCHDMSDSLAVRFAAMDGRLTPDELDAVMDHATEVPLFASGAEAAEHGERSIAAPSERARKTIRKLTDRRDRTESEVPHGA